MELQLLQRTTPHSFGPLDRRVGRRGSITVCDTDCMIQRRLTHLTRSGTSDRHFRVPASPGHYSRLPLTGSRTPRELSPHARTPSRCPLATAQQQVSPPTETAPASRTLGPYGRTLKHRQNPQASDADRRPRTTELAVKSQVARSIGRYSRRRRRSSASQCGAQTAAALLYSILRDTHAPRSGMSAQRPGTARPHPKKSTSQGQLVCSRDPEPHQEPFSRCVKTLQCRHSRERYSLCRWCLSQNSPVRMLCVRCLPRAKFVTVSHRNPRARAATVPVRGGGTSWQHPRAGAPAALTSTPRSLSRVRWDRTLARKRRR